ncbi:hypothetical protein [Devosia chinhatensis]|uniref:DUF4398 domain-containing protein n=1 Tax=Devosia chinhatensis TaxID=429727 RepID=A0A0F5FK49_9HYPH|nr:hypothetical protein [Devosia chinhatensis]KKB09168.1 hypothetical protein VE26_04005 [Devosia chinhatensis]
MTKTLLPAAALLAAFALAACGDAPDNAAAQPSQPAVSVETQPDGSSTVQINVPESMTPALDALSNPQQALEDLRSRAGSMTEQAKQDAVVNARNAAESAARALGQTEVEIQQAGDVAERSARDALGLR